MSVSVLENNKGEISRAVRSLPLFSLFVVARIPLSFAMKEEKEKRRR